MAPKLRKQNVTIRGGTWLSVPNAVHPPNLGSVSSSAAQSAPPLPSGWRAWVAGSRPRTLPAAVVPVAIGTALAHVAHHAVLWRAALALMVSVALQVAVNFANDYSDGIRGTDNVRVGPLRLVGSGVFKPQTVKLAAFIALAAAAIAGLVLASVTSWWLLAVGAAAMVSAWFYTGGSKPYGYAGFGEVFVFVFFGVVAVVGTVYVQTETFPTAAWIASVPVGLLAMALLVVNNLRDIPGDTTANKNTLAVRLGDPTTRTLYLACVGLGVLGCIPIAVAAHRPFALAGLATAAALRTPVNAITSGAKGRELIAVLGGTGKAQMVFGLLTTLGLLVHL
jgi:1,4-dihydroxy-2-naphthoate polyprenyltransferase